MSEWICVKDMLPQENVEVLCYNAKPNADVRHTHYMQCSRRHGKWWHTQTVSVPFVTHWMPLPPPPKD